MCSCSGPRGACSRSSSVRRLEDLRTMQFLSIAYQVEWHFQCMWLIARGRKHASSGQMERKMARLQGQRSGPRGNWTRNSDLRFPFPSGAQLSEVSVIPRLALFLVMTWLEPSQGKCSHCAPEGRGRHSPHTEQTFSGPLLGYRMAVSQLLANCGECPDGFQAGARREVSFPPTTRAAYVDTQ